MDADEIVRNDRLSEIQARCEAATPGPWKAVEHGNTVKSHAIVAINRDVSIVSIAAGISPRTGNAAFIAHAREDVPFLLSLIESLTAQLAESQRRERAAVEWANKFYAMLNHRRLYGFTDNGENVQLDTYDTWRGQEAGEGEAE